MFTNLLRLQIGQLISPEPFEVITSPMASRKTYRDGGETV